MNAGFLATWGPGLLGLVTVLAGGGFAKVMFDKALTKAQAQAATATAGKTVVEGEVAQSADDRAWVTQAREDVRAAQENARTEVAAARTQVTEFRTIAEDCRRAAWEAQDVAAACRTEATALRERVEHLEQSMRDCPRPGCPLRPLAPLAPPAPTGGTTL